MKRFVLILCTIMLVHNLNSQTIADFENLTLATDTFWDGSDLTGGFSSGKANFVNDYNTSFFSWSGFVYSNKKDSLTTGYGNQYSAVTATGYDGSANYAIADDYGNAKIILTGNAAGKLVKGFYLTNTTYTYQSMKNGDAFAKKFGGPSGTDTDWFNLRILAWKNGLLKSQFVDFYLADFRSSDSTQDYIVNDWQWVDLQPLGDVDSLLFNLSSSDTGSFGMNTPAYFAIDNFTTLDTALAQPVAVDDEISIIYSGNTVVSVLANDSGLVAGPFTVSLIGQPLITGATAAVTNNEINYWHGVGTTATDTIAYRVCDALNACSTANLIIHITGFSGISDFENLTLAADTFWEGSDLTGGFISGNASFANDYDATYFSWSGFAYSNKKDSLTAGYGNQYSAVTAGGYDGSPNYAIANEYGNAKIILHGNAAGKMVKGFYITNTTYAYQSMKHGDSFSKKFGGPSGTDSDWFKLRILAWKNGGLKSQFVDFYLSDFRSADSTQDYIVHDWRWVNLQSLGDADSLLFNLSSSDTGTFGMNTPAYFAIDNFTTLDTALAQPAALNDEISILNTSDTAVSVLANDAGLVVGPFTVSLIGQPLITGATDSVINNMIHYWPAVGATGTDTLLYRVCDDLNACSTAKLIIHITGLVSVDENSVAVPAIYPNPFSKKIIISSIETYNGLELYDVQGNLQTLVSRFSENGLELKTDQLSSGIYFIKLTAAGKVAVRKVVKE